MANAYTTLDDLFTAIANSIRAKNNSTAAIIADNFPTEISGLKTGFDYNNQMTAAIGDYEFRNCEDVNNVGCYKLTSIGTSAFENCSNLKIVVLYEGVTSVGENAFKGCSNATIYCMLESQPESWNTNWNPDNLPVEWLGEAIETWNISATEEDNVTAKLYNVVGNEGKYSLVISGSGDMMDYANIIYVPWYNNYADNIVSVIISNSVTSIGKYAFANFFDLTLITIPNSVTRIGESTFAGCTELTSITIPNSVTSIGDYAFYNCTNLTSITIPNSVTSIGNYAFSLCTKLTSITIPNGVTRIGERTFTSCNKLTSITIPDSVTNIGYRAFDRCIELTSITYTGTMEQWNTITFDPDWNQGTGNYTIHCTDGDIAKS